MSPVDNTECGTETTPAGGAVHHDWKRKKALPHQWLFKIQSSKFDLYKEIGNSYSCLYGPTVQQCLKVTLVSLFWYKCLKIIKQTTINALDCLRWIKTKMSETVYLTGSSLCPVWADEEGHWQWLSLMEGLSVYCNGRSASPSSLSAITLYPHAYYKEVI